MSLTYGEPVFAFDLGCTDPWLQPHIHILCMQRIESLRRLSDSSSSGFSKLLGIYFGPQNFFHNDSIQQICCQTYNNCYLLVWIFNSIATYIGKGCLLLGIFFLPDFVEMLNVVVVSSSSFLLQKSSQLPDFLPPPFRYVMCLVQFAH